MTHQRVCAEAATTFHKSQILTQRGRVWILPVDELLEESREQKLDVYAFETTPILR
jgi:hypothetical protein